MLAFLLGLEALGNYFWHLSWFHAISKGPGQWWKCGGVFGRCLGIDLLQILIFKLWFLEIINFALFGQLVRDDYLQLRQEAMDLQEYSSAKLDRVTRYLGVLADKTRKLGKM